MNMFHYREMFFIGKLEWDKPLARSCAHIFRTLLDRVRHLGLLLLVHDIPRWQHDQEGFTSFHCPFFCRQVEWGILRHVSGFRIFGVSTFFFFFFKHGQPIVDCNFLWPNTNKQGTTRILVLLLNTSWHSNASCLLGKMWFFLNCVWKTYILSIINKHLTIL